MPSQLAADTLKEEAILEAAAEVVAMLRPHAPQPTNNQPLRSTNNNISPTVRLQLTVVLPAASHPSKEVAVAAARAELEMPDLQDPQDRTEIPETTDSADRMDSQAPTPRPDSNQAPATFASIARQAHQDHPEDPDQRDHQDSQDNPEAPQIPAMAALHQAHQDLPDPQDNPETPEAPDKPDHQAKFKTFPEDKDHQDQLDPQEAQAKTDNPALQDPANQDHQDLLATKDHQELPETTACPEAADKTVDQEAAVAATIAHRHAPLPATKPTLPSQFTTIDSDHFVPMLRNLIVFLFFVVSPACRRTPECNVYFEGE